MSTTSGSRATPSNSNASRRNGDDDTDMDEEAQAPVHTSVYPVAKPEPFDGTREKLEDWLMKFDLFFMFQGERIPEEKRVTFVSTFMKDRAFTWIKPFLRRYHGEGISTDIDSWIEDFDLFKEQIRQVFGVHNEPIIARRNIQRLKQTSSAADYAAKFQEIATFTGFDNTALATMFKQGLKPKVKEELMRTAAVTDTYQTLVNEAINIDIKLYELQMELRDDTRVKTINAPTGPKNNQWRNNNLRRGQRGNNYGSNTGRRIHNNTSSGHYGPEAMDLSNINKGQPRWNEKNKGSNNKGKDKSSVTCYNCNKTGHYARDCRMKNKVVRQLNVLTHGKDEGSDWEVITNEVGRLMEDSSSGSEYEDCTETDEDKRNIRERAPTPHPKEECAWIRNDPQRYAVIECDTQGTTIVMGKKHYDDFYQIGDKHYSAEGKRLMVHDKTLVDPVRYDMRQTMRERGIQPTEKTSTTSRGTQTSREPTPPKETVINLTINNLPRPKKGDTAQRREEQTAMFDEQIQTYEQQQHPDYLSIVRSRTYLNYDLTAQQKFDQQIKNAELTEGEWRQEAFHEWAKNNTATRERLNHALAITRGRHEQDYSRAPAKTSTNETISVRQDERNPLHYMLHASYCYHNACTFHELWKIDNGWFPTKPQGCSREWYVCDNPGCTRHVWDKRTKLHFPGLTYAEDILEMHLVQNNICDNLTWATCLNPKCTQHHVTKELLGFTNEQAFLGQHREGAEEESTEEDTSTQYRAPGIDVRIPMRPIHSSNSPSY